MIKAVLFDIDGVLLDSFSANTKFFQDLLVDSGYRKPSRQDNAKIFHTDMLNTIRILTKEKSEEKIMEIWKKGHKFKYPKDLLKIPSGSQDVIRKLRSDYKLGIVTNRIKRGVDVFFEVSKMKKYFDTVVMYENTKKHKPEPEPLLLAAKRLKIKPEMIVYVGDMKSDMLAAKAAGMKFILYSKENIKGADVCVKSFGNIPSSILKINGGR